MATRQEREANERFSQRYGEERGNVAHAIELSVIGGDWGANGYTTIAQADQLAAVLEPVGVRWFSMSGPIGDGPACTWPR